MVHRIWAAEKAGAEVVVEAAAFTEGDQGHWERIISLEHLPIFID